MTIISLFQIYVSWLFKTAMSKDLISVRQYFQKGQVMGQGHVTLKCLTFDLVQDVVTYR